jgi:hypothetical protein
MQDLRVLEDGHVEIDGFFGIAVEPETRSNRLRHAVLLTAHAGHAGVTARSASDPQVASID